MCSIREVRLEEYKLYVIKHFQHLLACACSVLEGDSGVRGRGDIEELCCGIHRGNVSERERVTAWLRKSRSKVGVLMKVLPCWVTVWQNEKLKARDL